MYNKIQIKYEQTNVIKIKIDLKVNKNKLITCITIKLKSSNKF